MIKKNWQELVKPRAIDIQTSYSVVTIIAEPLERGFGFTLGNALRRLLLSSLEGSAVTAVRIDGAPAATAKLAGVIEELDEILLNLKEIAISAEAASTPARLLLRKRGPGSALAGDILALGGIEIVNPDHAICTLEHGCEISMELIVAAARGYVPAAMQPAENAPPGFIPVDSVHSPVRTVSYAVEDARLGQVLDYDRLALTIETNGAISGEQALAFAARIFHDQLGVFINFEEAVPEPPVAQERELPFDPALLRRIDEFELSVRSANCLRHDNVVYVGDLVTRTEQKMMLTPNFGRKSLSEIKTLLAGMGLKLGMDISVWPPDNIEELARRYVDVH